MSSTQAAARGDDRRRGKVFWTQKERERIAEEAARLQREDPGLAGLRLLTAAMKALPRERRRDIVTLRQVPFFESMLSLLVKAKEAETKAKAGGPVETRLVPCKDDPHVPLLAEIAENQRRYIAQTEKLTASYAELIAVQREAVTHLTRLLKEWAEMNRHLSRQDAYAEETLRLLKQIREAASKG